MNSKKTYKPIIFFIILFLPYVSKAQNPEVLTLKHDGFVKIVREHSPGASFQFEGKQGDVINLKIKSITGPDIFISVKDPKGKDITSSCNESPVSDKDEKCEPVISSWVKELPLTGSYTINLDTMEPVFVKYELTISHSSAKVAEKPEAICSSPWLEAELKTYPLDEKSSKCIEKDQNEFQCFTQSLEDWDAQLNVFYQNLKSQRGQLSKLAGSQLEWIKQRDQEFEYYQSLVEDSEGSMYPILLLVWKRNFVRDRVLQMRQILMFLCTEQ